VIDPFYEKFLRPIFFRLEAEEVHDMTINGLCWLSRMKFVCQYLHKFNGTFSKNPVHLFGLKFPNLVGLAAGLDKNAQCLPAFSAMGFGHVEAGTVTPRPQPGNERPRLFRYPEKEAVLNRMGFNNDGAEEMKKRIQRSMPKERRSFPVGVNIGKARSTALEDAVDDYLACFNVLADQADYFTVNISSPNTPGLRKLQEEDYLRELLGALQTENNDRAQRLGSKPLPILVKIAPDLDYPQIEELIDILLDLGYDGVIATNTTIARTGYFKTVQENGGISGRPLQDKSDKVIRFIHRITSGKLPIIGVGGIMDVASAAQKMDEGASLVQVYSGLIYRGPSFVRALARGLSERQG
jgi:dihydroorotate dehydrogenase